MSEASSEHWDLVVVGAGPAGAATALGALHANPRLRVLLLDRANFPRDKCCGDGIAPHVFEALAGVDVHGVEAGWTPLTRLELARGTSQVARPMARPVYVIPREVFDARLLERAVDAGAALARHGVGGLRRDDTDVLIDERFRATVVVGADGAHSVVRDWLTDHSPGHKTGRQGRRALAIRGYAPTAPGRTGTQVIRYGSRRQPAYAWAFDRGDGLSNIGYGELLPDDRSQSPSRQLLLDELDRLLPGAAEGGSDWRAHHLPLSGFTWRQPPGPVLLAGDAAGLINPMTGEGIYYAVATGISAGQAAAEALSDGDAAAAGRLHQKRVRRMLARHLRHTWIAARLAAVPLVVEAGIRAARADARAFDDLVEIGLGDGLISPRLAAGLATKLVVTTPKTPEPAGR